MKKILLYSICLFTFYQVRAQSKDEKWNLGVHGGMTQYSGDLGQGFYDFNQAAYGLVGVSVSRYLTKRFDASFFITRGEAGYMKARDYSVDRSIPFAFRTRLGAANLLLRYHFVSRESHFAPYIFAGGGVINQMPFGGDERPLIETGAPTGGLGIIFRLGPFISIQLQEMLTYTGSDDIDFRTGGYNDSYLFHSVGITFNLEKAERRRFGSRAGGSIDKCFETGKGSDKKIKEPQLTKTKAKVKQHADHSESR